MQISKKDWLSYIDKLAKLNKEASDLMVQYVQQNGFSNRRALIDYAYGLVNKYGNGSAALAAAMYDAVAEASGMWLEPAEMPDLISEDEVAKTVNGTLKRSKNVNELGGAVSRLVKRQSADTMLNNAYRDRKGGRKYGKKRNTGAQVAWIPVGDTCPFCLMLASNGWRNQTVGGANHHAEHIHSHCDCNYAVRFDDSSGVEGYNPDTYLEMFDDVEGDTWEEKVNAMRRQQYEQNKDEINAQKRAAYAERNLLKSDSKNGMLNKSSERSRNHRLQNAKFGNNAIWADKSYIDSDEYINKFRGITEDEKVNQIIAQTCKEIVNNNSGTFDETLVLLDKKTGNEVIRIKGVAGKRRIKYEPEQEKVIEDAKNRGIEILAIHNHPTGYPPTVDDCVSARQRGYSIGITCGHNGTVFIYYPSTVDFSNKECDEIHNIIAEESMYEKDINKVLDTWKNVFSEFELRIREKG